MREGREREPFAHAVYIASMTGQSCFSIGQDRDRVRCRGSTKCCDNANRRVDDNRAGESGVSHDGNRENITQLGMENCFPICTNIPPQIILFGHRQPVSMTH